MFKKTNTWYNHVQQEHYEEYSKKDAGHHEGGIMEESEGESSDHTEAFLGVDEGEDEISPEPSPLSAEVVAGKLLKMNLYLML